MTHHGNADEHADQVDSDVSESGEPEVAGRAQADDVVEQAKEMEEQADREEDASS